jgi:hypothetical protein
MGLHLADITTTCGEQSLLLVARAYVQSMQLGHPLLTISCQL